MKVLYIEDCPDESVAPGFVFKKGWTAEHTDPEAELRIEDGYCVEVSKDTQARTSGITTDCIGKKMNEAKKAYKTKNKH